GTIGRRPRRFEGTSPEPRVVISSTSVALRRHDWENDAMEVGGREIAISGRRGPRDAAPPQKPARSRSGPFARRLVGPVGAAHRERRAGAGRAGRLRESRRMDAATPRRQAAWLGLLLAAYLVSRLYALSALPVFVDEAMHIRWARETLQGHLLAGSFDGRWLPIKVMAAFVALPLPPLLAARLAAVLAGAGTLVACVLVGRRLYSPRVGSIAGLLYLVAPFALLHNRMALADTFAATFAGAALYFSIAAAT